VLWFVSWFMLYLETVRYHHVVLARLGDVLIPSASAAARPGVFVRLDILCALLTPLVCTGLWLSNQTRGKSSDDQDAAGSAWSLAALIALFGLSLVALGLTNQLLRPQPIVVDMMLRTGNGGFLVLGLACLVSGILIHRSKRHPESKVRRSPTSFSPPPD
jgi:hypothetical protein